MDNNSKKMMDAVIMRRKSELSVQTDIKQRKTDDAESFDELFMDVIERVVIPVMEEYQDYLSGEVQTVDIQNNELGQSNASVSIRITLEPDIHLNSPTGDIRINCDSATKLIRIRLAGRVHDGADGDFEEYSRIGLQDINEQFVSNIIQGLVEKLFSTVA